MNKWKTENRKVHFYAALQMSSLDTTFGIFYSGEEACKSKPAELTSLWWLSWGHETQLVPTAR